MSSATPTTWWSRWEEAGPCCVPYVLGTARAESHQLLTELGVDEAIDYTRQDVGHAVQDVDVVSDLIGGNAGPQSLPTLRDGGLLISVPASTDIGPLRKAAQDRVRVTGILVEPDRTGMEAIAALVEEGARMRVARTLPPGAGGPGNRVR